MRRSSVMLLLLAAIEILLAAGGFYMVVQVRNGAWNIPDPVEAIRRIATVLGAAMPLVAFVFLIIAVPMRRKGL